MDRLALFLPFREREDIFSQMKTKIEKRTALSNFSLKKQQQKKFSYVISYRRANETGSTFVFVFLPQMDKLEIGFRYPLKKKKIVLFRLKMGF